MSYNEVAAGVGLAFGGAGFLLGLLQLHITARQGEALLDISRSMQRQGQTVRETMLTWQKSVDDTLREVAMEQSASVAHITDLRQFIRWLQTQVEREG